MAVVRIMARTMNAVVSIDAIMTIMIVMIRRWHARNVQSRCPYLQSIVTNAAVPSRRILNAHHAVADCNRKQSSARPAA
jgi:hypothetical protein